MSANMKPKIQIENLKQHRVCCRKKDGSCQSFILQTTETLHVMRKHIHAKNKSKQSSICRTAWDCASVCSSLPRIVTVESNHISCMFSRLADCKPVGKVCMKACKTHLVYQVQSKLFRSGAQPGACCWFTVTYTGFCPNTKVQTVFTEYSCDVQGHLRNQIWPPMTFFCSLKWSLASSL